jgi:ribosomal protein S18 acetylase RimI-like enzyme
MQPLERNTSPSIQIIAALSKSELQVTRILFEEYALSLDVDLCFQNFSTELNELPGEYILPRGTLLLAKSGDEWAGCCALRPLDSVDYANACEMKRLFVKPSFRGLGVGRMLSESILEAAGQAGYACVLLDTLSEMEAARALYEDLGFYEIAPYYHNPIAGAHYLMADL